MVRGLTCFVVILLATSAGAQQQPQQQQKRDMLSVQVLVDRAGFSPGEIDGRGGANTDKAIEAYERTTGTHVGDLVVGAPEPPTKS
jgi:peptidoglycan hydrolase-like protein with peptidoglycan-binding domain